MKSLELKALKMNDNFPLIISLNGKVEWELDDKRIYGSYSHKKISICLFN